MSRKHVLMGVIESSLWRNISALPQDSAAISALWVTTALRQDLQESWRAQCRLIKSHVKQQSQCHFILCLFGITSFYFLNVLFLNAPVKHVELSCVQMVLHK